ncbi:two-component system regulatory protein YycI [Vagococcus elongatus]|nr:two-component system regulatory protein YycI [Vagococcus elongatus]
MDFKRIELIFLCTFLTLNIFLLYTFFQGKNESVSSNGINNMQNIEARLSEEKIKFDHTFSKESGEAYYLSATPTDFYELDSVLASGVKLVERQVISKDISARQTVIFDEEHATEEATHFIHKGNQVVFGDDYEYHGNLVADKNSFYFSQEYKDIPFYDETSALVLNVEAEEGGNYKLLDYTQTHLSNVEELREKQSIITEHDAIVTLYLSNKIPSGSAIEKTALVYTRIYAVKEKHVYVPAWYVWVDTNGSNTSQLEKVNAFSNTIITTTVSDLKKE